MAQITGSTTGAISGGTLTELVPADIINSAFILPANRAPNIGQSLCWGVDMGAAGLGRGSVFRFPKFNAVDPTFTEASPKTEADDGFWGTLQDHETTETSATAVVVGVQGFISDEALQDAGLPLTQFLGQQAEGMRKRVSLDIMLNTLNATSSTDKSGEQLTKANFLTWWTAWSAQDVSTGGPYQEFAVLDTGAFGYFMTALANDGASLQPALGAAGLFSAMQGLKGSYMGCNIVVSNDVAEHNGSNHSNAILAVGTGSIPGQVRVGSALACVNWLHAGVSPDVYDGIRLEAHRDARNTAGYYLTAQCRYGTTITNNTNMRELIAID